MDGAGQCRGIILTEELFPCELLSTEGDGGWRDAGSTLKVGLNLRVQQALRERAHSWLTRQGRDLLLSQSWDVEGKSPWRNVYGTACIE